MTYTPTKQEIEDAALACGKINPHYVENTSWGTGISAGTGDEVYVIWRPHIDAGDRMAMIEAIPLDIRWRDDVVIVISDENDYFEQVDITNGNKQAALAEAVIKVAAQVGAKMRGGV